MGESCLRSAQVLVKEDGGKSPGRFQRPSERVPFSDEGGFVFTVYIP